jgi:hypothetical protein
VLKLSASHHFTAVSPLPPDQCLEILKSLTDPAPIFRVLPGKRPLIGTIYDTWALVQKQTGGRGEFCGCLDLDFAPSTEGTQITGRFNMSIGTRLFTLTFIGGCAYIAFVILYAAYENPASSPVLVFIPLAMMGAVCASYSTGRMASEEDIPEVLALLEQSLQLTVTQKPT